MRRRSEFQRLSHSLGTYIFRAVSLIDRSERRERRIEVVVVSIGSGEAAALLAAGLVCSSAVGGHLAGEGRVRLVAGPVVDGRRVDGLEVVRGVVQAAGVVGRAVCGGRDVDGRVGGGGGGRGRVEVGGVEEGAGAGGLVEEGRGRRGDRGRLDAH